MAEQRKRLLKNVLANLIRGGAAALVSLLLPPILVRHMTPVAYGAWVLILQVAAYVGYLDFGLQTAVGRYVAFANEKRDPAQRDSIFSTAFVGLALAGLLGLVVLSVVVVFLPRIFPGIPREFVSTMRFGIMIVGGTMAIGLPASAWTGVFIGIQRYDIPAWTIGGTKVAGGLVLIVAVLCGSGLIGMAIALSTVTVCGYIFQYVLLRHVVPDVHFQRKLASVSAATELLQYCFGITVMSFSMLLVTGLDVVLVGRFEFSALVAYSVASVLITFLAGLLSAANGVIMPHAAALHARDDSEGLGRVVLRSTRLSVLVLIFVAMPLLIYAGPLIRVWIGEQHEVMGKNVLAVLLIANVIRLTPLAYSIVVVATGEHRIVKASPLTEGIGNLVASVILGIHWGAIGVAYGTLVGAVLGVLVHLSYSMPNTMSVIKMPRRRFVTEGILIPALCCSPLLLVGVCSYIGMNTTLLVVLLGFVASLLFSLALLSKKGELRFARPSN